MAHLSPTDDSPAPLDNPFWEYSLAAYARLEVSQLCLQLQDEGGFNVNLLLFCAWAATQKIALSTSDFLRLSAAIAPLDEITTPLRQLRRSLPQYSLPSAWNTAIRQQLLTAELTAEQMQQATLYRQMRECSGESSSEFLVLLTANVETYAATKDFQQGQLIDWLHALCRALA